MISPLRFVSLGLGHVVCANKIYAVVRPDTAYAHRLIVDAKKEGRFLDWRRAKPAKSIVIMDDGQVIACFFSVATVFKRLQEITTYDLVPDDMIDNEDENEN